ncbi:glycosyltransferase family 2 protein [Treponema sp.]
MIDIQLTIFTPTFNRKDTLINLYHSLSNQTRKDFEWYIIDDGSTDNTSDIVKYFIEQKIIKIKYLYKENEGKTVAYNLALSLTNSKYFTCIDSDDILSNNFAIENALNQINNSINHNSKVIGYLFNCIDFKYNVIGNKINRIFTSTIFDYYHKNNGYGDKFIIFITQLHKHYFFPYYALEKFVPEALIYNRMSKKYTFIFFPDNLKMVEYRNDGLSKNYRKLIISNPTGFFTYFNELLDMNISFKSKTYYSIHCLRLSFHKPIFFKHIKFSLIYLFIFPISIYLYIRDKFN